MSILGLHHMTAISGDAQENVDFYTGVLGLRLVKVTVNFDDPSAYHLYYGDGAGSPGTILTFFPYPGGRPGRTGLGQATITSLSVPAGSLDYWRNRLGDLATPSEREDAIDFADPDGLLLRLVADPSYELMAPWEKSDVPVEHQIGGMHSITLNVADVTTTSTLLMRVMGYDEASDVPEDAPNFHFTVGKGGMTRRVEMEVGHTPGHGGRGTVHHIAFRTPSDATQLKLREELESVGAYVSEVRDRDYFHSIYFREPNGVLFEIATDPPGFATDESPENLGTGLRLPAMHEPRRAEIERSLRKLRLPGGVEVPA